MSTYDLQAKDLSYCDVYWSKEKQQFMKNDPYDEAECCMSTCKDMINSCYSNSGADEKCSLAVLDCENHCNKAIQPEFSKMTDCVASNNCGTFPILDTECLKKNKDSIILCCKENLSQKSCDILYKKVLAGDKTSLWPINEQTQSMEQSAEQSMEQSTLQSTLQSVKQSIEQSIEQTDILFYCFCFMMGIITIFLLNKYFHKLKRYGRL